MIKTFGHYPSVLVKLKVREQQEGTIALPGQ
jgi:hypothetical protein